MKRNDCLKNLVRLCLLVCGWLLGACLLTACQGNGGGTETRMPDTSTATDSPVTLPATDTDSGDSFRDSANYRNGCRNRAGHRAGSVRV